MSEETELATKADIQLVMDAIECLYNTNESWKKEIIMSMKQQLRIAV